MNITREKMRIMLKGVVIDDRTESYIIKRLKSLEKLSEKNMRVEVEVDRDKKGKFRIEVMVKTPRNMYRAEETTESIEGSIDLVVDELKNQIRKNKEKLSTLKMRGERSIKKKVVIDKNARF